MQIASRQWARRFTWIAIAFTLGLASRTSVEAAGPLHFTLPAGSTTGGGKVDAQAFITLGTDRITVQLENLLGSDTKGALGANSIDDAQLLSGIYLKVNGISVGNTAVLTGSQGKAFTVNSSNANSSYSTLTDSGPLAHWGAKGTGGNVNLATIGTPAASGKPFNLIIGPDTKDGFDRLGTYYVNNSVIQHDPVVAGKATFTIQLLGVTPTSTLDNEHLYFQFGTEADDGENRLKATFVKPNPGPIVPEPAALAMGLIAATILGGMRMVARRWSAA